MDPAFTGVSNTYKEGMFVIWKQDFRPIPMQFPPLSLTIVNILHEKFANAKIYIH